MLCLPAVRAETPDRLEVSIANRIELSVSRDRQGELFWHETRRQDLRIHTRAVIRDLAEARRFYIFDDENAPFDKVRGNRNGRSLGVPVLKMTGPRPDAFMGSWTWYVLDWEQALKNFRPGDFFRTDTERSCRDFSQFPSYLVDGADSLEAFELRLTVPEDLNASFEWNSSWRDVRTSIEKGSDGEQIFRVTPMRTPEPLALHGDNDLLARLVIHLSLADSSLVPEGPVGFTRWYGSLTTLEPRLDQPFPPDLSTELESAETDRARLLMMTRWVARNIRYVSDTREMRGLVSASPDETLTSRFGDCKAKSTLLCAISDRYSIPLHMALVNTDDRHMRGCRAGDFNHMIVAWHNGNDWEFGDPTDRGLDFGVPNPDLHAHPVLVLQPDNPTIVYIDAEAELPQLELSLVARRDSLARSEARLILRGSLASRGREYARDRKDLDLSNWLATLVGGYCPSVALRDIRIEDDRSPDLICVARADMGSMLVKGRRGDYLPRFPLTGFSLKAKDRIGDGEALHLSYPLHLKLQLALAAPGLTPAADSLDLGDPRGASYTARVICAEDTARMECHLRLRAGTQEGQDRVWVEDLIRAMNDERNNYFRLSSPDSDSQE
ncbi:MAG: transglutaminase domain-containing protein [Calditrichaeota bacterium]|nr:transglutaminase domain-containing protein [Calditrichota bacterium]